MPWRDTQNPYSIWLAEIMLQQTTVAAVIPYYRRFLAAFPTVQTLAAAPIEQILHLWAGLGYYRRAHLLHKCAQTIAGKHHGHFPSTEAELLQLPGLGPYTAAVIAATAFNQPATVVDGNVERVITRLYTINAPLPKSKPLIRQKAALLSPLQPTTYNLQPRLYANAIMELGATICTPQNPKCLLCPVQQFCAAHAAGNPAAYPVKAAKKALPQRSATAYAITDSSGNLYLRQRPATGLLASLWELPHTGNWEAHQPPAIPLTQQTPAGEITHTFTHFKLTLNLIRATTPHTLPAANAFAPSNLPPLSTLMKKALTRAFTP